MRLRINVLEGEKIEYCVSIRATYKVSISDFISEGDITEPKIYICEWKKFLLFSAEVENGPYEALLPVEGK
jgi:hypothetical protein